MIRPPAVAGRFYPADPAVLLSQVNQFVAPRAIPTKERIHARGCVVPHAGYIYSGHVAGAVYSAIELPSRFILLGPRH